MFENTDNSDIVDEYTFHQLQNRTVAREQLASTSPTTLVFTKHH
jgi:hypothetical protein